MKLKTQGTIAIIAALAVLFLAIFNQTLASGLGVFCLAALGVYCYAIQSEGQSSLAKGQTQQTEDFSQTQHKKEHLQTILEMVQKKGSVNSREICEVLGVSDGTAASYLARLEMEGKLTQLGDSGRYIFYNLR